MMAADIVRAPTFRAGVPRELFRGRYHHSQFLRTYDVARDGRFVMVQRASGLSAPEVRSLRVVLNWHEELKRLVPRN